MSGTARLIVTGVGLLVVLMVIPGGIAQPFLNLRDRVLRKVAAWRGIHVPSLFEDRRVGEDGEEQVEEASFGDATLGSDEDTKPRRARKAGVR